MIDYCQEVREAILEGLFEEETRLLDRLTKQHQTLHRELRQVTDRINACQVARSGILHMMNRKLDVTA